MFLFFYVYWVFKVIFVSFWKIIYCVFIIVIYIMFKYNKEFKGLYVGFWCEGFYFLNDVCLKKILNVNLFGCYMYFLKYNKMY